MVIDTGGVLTISKSRDDVMEELAISTTIGMEGIPLASREAAVARMPSMIEKQATVAVEEASVIIFLVDGQVSFSCSCSSTHSCLTYLVYVVSSKMQLGFHHMPLTITLQIYFYDNGFGVELCSLWVCNATVDRQV